MARFFVCYDSMLDCNDGKRVLNNNIEQSFLSYLTTKITSARLV